jgi:hypothetical protein
VLGLRPRWRTSGLNLYTAAFSGWLMKIVELSIDGAARDRL